MSGNSGRPTGLLQPGALTLNSKIVVLLEEGGGGGPRALGVWWRGPQCNDDDERVGWWGGFKPWGGVCEGAVPMKGSSGM